MVVEVFVDTEGSLELNLDWLCWEASIRIPNSFELLALWGRRAVGCTL